MATKWKIDIKSLKVLVSGNENYYGLYINDCLVAEGRELTPNMILSEIAEALGCEYEWVDDPVDFNFERFGRHCPPTWPNDVEE